MSGAKRVTSIPGWSRLFDWMGLTPRLPCRGTRHDVRVLTCGLVVALNQQDG
jgi:hypothetical protein